MHSNEARDPKTPPARLAELAEDETLREAVAGNPNAAPALLYTLALDHAETVLANPVLPLLTLADLRFWSTVPRAAITAFLKTDAPPGDLLQWAATQPTHEAAVAAHPRTPPALLPPLARSTQQATRQALAERETLPPDLAAVLAADAVQAVRAGAAHHLTEAQRADYVRLGSTPDLKGFGQPDPSLPPDRIAEAVGEGVWPQRLALRHPATPSSLVDALVQSDVLQVVYDAVASPHLSEASALRLIRSLDSDPAFSSAPTQALLLSRLARHAAPALLAPITHQALGLNDQRRKAEILLAVARRPDAPATTLARLAREVEHQGTRPPVEPIAEGWRPGYRRLLQTLKGHPALPFVLRVSLARSARPAPRAGRAAGVMRPNLEAL